VFPHSHSVSDSEMHCTFRNQSIYSYKGGTKSRTSLKFITHATAINSLQSLSYIHSREILHLHMQILGVIPARYGSSRFPGKPLTVIRGKTMIRRVWEQASAAKSLHRVIVATDDERIAGEIRNAG